MRKSAVILVLIVVAALLVLGLYAVCGSTEGKLQCVRDVAIIVLVLETFVVTLLMALMVMLFANMLSTIRNEVLPILNSARRTVDTVQGTTTFVSDSLVAPLISIAGFGSAIRGTLGALVGRKQRRKQP